MKFINLIRYIIKAFIRLNIIKTLYINFRMLPFEKAVKLPIFVYKKVRIKTLKGKINIYSPITTGLIKIGHDMDGTNFSFLPVLLYITGELNFEGSAIISKGVVINVQGKLNIGNGCTIGSGTFIKSMSSIVLKDNVQITYNCTVFDSDMHYVKDIGTGIVKNNTAPIVIGNNCWINSGTIVSKGTVLPDYSITARNSYLAKDYSEFGDNLFLVGAPAKPTKSKVQRIFSVKEEQRIKSLFEKSGKNEVDLGKGAFDEGSDVESFFINI